jgi:hypothetical protein
MIGTMLALSTLMSLAGTVANTVTGITRAGELADILAAEKARLNTKGNLLNHQSPLNTPEGQAAMTAILRGQSDALKKSGQGNTMMGASEESKNASATGINEAYNKAVTDAMATVDAGQRPERMANEQAQANIAQQEAQLKGAQMQSAATGVANAGNALVGASFLAGEPNKATVDKTKGGLLSWKGTPGSPTDNPTGIGANPGGEWVGNNDFINWSQLYKQPVAPLLPK